MKTLIAALIAIMLVLPNRASAVRIGLIGGLNLAKVAVEDDATSFRDNMEYNEAFHLGLIVEIPITDLLLLEPGVVGSIKGFRVRYDDSIDPITQRIYLAYADIPVNLKVRIPLGLVRPYVEAGPYVGLGIYGRTWETYGNDDESEEIEWGSDPGQIKRADFGINFGAGIELGRVIFGASYGLGLVDISNMEGGSMKHRVIRFTLGVKFGQGK
jgi:hypothetical protein